MFIYEFGLNIMPASKINENNTNFIDTFNPKLAAWFWFSTPSI